MGDTRLCKVRAGNQDYYLLSTELTDDGECDGFQLALCDGKNAWCGTVTGDALEVSSKKIHMDYEEMITQTRKAITKHKMGNINFIYDTKPAGNNALQFIWKKHVTAENIKFQLGNVELQRSSTPSDVVCKIFEHSIESACVLQEIISSLESDTERLVSERAAAIKRLEKHVNAKVDIENDLYSKFVVVLNDKKAKIRDLRDHRMSVPDSDVTADNSAPRTAAGQSDDVTDGEGSHDGERESPIKREYDSEYNTDEDEKVVSAPTKKVRKVKEEALNSSGDASLMLDGGGDDEDDQQAPVGRRRRGRASSGKKQTPAKPVIPRVPSSETKDKPGTSKRSRKSSMKKSTSLNSSKSDNVDELMDIF